MSVDESTAEGAQRYQDFILERELAEVYLLLDNLSGSATKNLGELSADAPKLTVRGHPTSDWIAAVCKIGWPPANTPQDEAEDIANLIRVRDYLNRRAAPANGSTIAFTLLVGGEGKERAKDKAAKDKESAKDKGGEGEESGPKAGGASDAGLHRPGPMGALMGGEGGPSRVELADRAFPHLQTRVTSFRIVLGCIAGLLLAVLVGTCLLSWDTANGNALLAQATTAAADRATILDQIDNASGTDQDDSAKSAGSDARSETASDAGASAGGAAANAEAAKKPAKPTVVRYCDRPKLLKAAADPKTAPYDQFDSPAQARLCDDLHLKEAALDAAGANLSGWLSRWSLLAPAAAPPPICPDPTNCARFQADAQRAGDAQRASGLLGVLSGGVLPFFYGLLGAGAAVVRDLASKLRNWQLAPRDDLISVIQLALGAVLGACIGLFVTPAGAAGVAAGTGSGAAANQGLLGPVHLSAAALCFIAGFFVEGVFRALEGLMTRVFDLADTTPKPQR
ncbi:MAG TPA: hypothetical protein VGG29_18065 [Caulobacteraceae bacterium]|jgi:hypothetical protein